MGPQPVLALSSPRLLNGGRARASGVETERRESRFTKCSKLEREGVVGQGRGSLGAVRTAASLRGAFADWMRFTERVYEGIRYI